MSVQDTEATTRQRSLAKLIGERFCFGLPCEPAGPPGSFSAEPAYAAVSACMNWPEDGRGAVEAGLACALSSEWRIWTNKGGCLTFLVAALSGSLSRANGLSGALTLRRTPA